MLNSATEDMLTLTCCQNHILTEIYGFYAWKHYILEMRGDVTDAGRQTTNKQTITKGRATQPMEAGG